MINSLGEIFLKELEAEVMATRKCLERIPMSLFDWRPHDKSMQMGYLALVVADIPKWITTIVEEDEIDFAKWEKYNEDTFKNIVEYFDKNVVAAKNSLKNISDEKLQKMFFLKSAGKELMKDTKENNISSSINHLVHHRGQLTVYMRLNNIPVPAIYGPSADEREW